MRSLFQKIKKRLIGVTERDILDNLRRGGAIIGEKVKIFSPNRTIIDSTRPWLLTIGSYTKITQGVTILTHDYSLSVLRRVYGDWIGEGEETIIGENCFLGVNSILLMGTHLGNNVIVGAGSVVRGFFPDNVVIAGNPARVVCTLEEHYQRRCKKTIQEAVACAKRYREIFGERPTPKDLEGFKFLFVPRNSELVKEYGLSFQCSGDEPSEVEEAFYQTKPYWSDFEKFLVETEKEENR